ncbi:MAG: single-stranded DNA-binding protein [Bacteroidetes bacterium]|nr:single-stranded DNA-binding protein [Bacteroidota bacterium]
MATVFETRLIGNIGKDATLRHLENGVSAIQFSVAHNKNWKDKKTGESKTKTTWVNCTIWKKPNSNFDLLKFLKKGTLVEVIGTPVARASTGENGSLQAEIRLTVENVNILRHSDRLDDEEQIVENERDETSFIDDVDLY